MYTKHFRYRSLKFKFMTCISFVDESRAPKWLWSGRIQTLDEAPSATVHDRPISSTLARSDHPLWTWLRTYTLHIKLLFQRFNLVFSFPTNSIVSNLTFVFATQALICTFTFDFQTLNSSFQFCIDFSNLKLTNLNVSK